MPAFGATMLDNVSDLLLEPVSLVTVSTPYLSLWIFALPFTPNPFQTFWLHSFKIVSQVCSLSSEVMDVSQIWILHIAANSKVRLFSICLKFGPIFLCVKIFCRQTVGCWAKYNWWASAPTKRVLRLSYTKSMTHLKKVRTKVPKSGNLSDFQNSPRSLHFGSPY